MLPGLFFLRVLLQNLLADSLNTVMILLYLEGIS
jgi:hypothetical protein